jgi:hypothetical protein
MTEILHCKDCRFVREIKPLIVNPEKINVAADLVDCILINKTVILTDVACEEIKEKKKHK